MAAINTLFETIEKPLKLADSTFICFILENKLRVITIDSFQKALGYEGQFKNWFLDILNGINDYFPIATEILEAFENPLKVKIKNGANYEINCIEAKQILSICKTLVKIKNEGLLNAGQIKIGKTAQSILDSIQTSNIYTLIDDISGFNNYKLQVIEKCGNTLKKRQKETALEWVKTFPSAFVESLFEMNAIEWIDVEQYPEKLGNILNEVLFSRIENAQLEDLRSLKPKRTYRRKNGIKQEFEHPELKKRIAVIESLAKASGYQWNIFVQLLNKAYPKQKNSLKPVTYIENEKSQTLSEFNICLLKTLAIKPKKLV